MSKKRKKPSSNLLNTTSFKDEYPEYKCLLRPNFRELAESYAEFSLPIRETERPTDETTRQTTATASAEE
jgi:hypothetical protein